MITYGGAVFDVPEYELALQALLEPDLVSKTKRIRLSRSDRFGSAATGFARAELDKKYGPTHITLTRHPIRYHSQRQMDTWDVGEGKFDRSGVELQVSQAHSSKPAAKAQGQAGHRRIYLLALPDRCAILIAIETTRYAPLRHSLRSQRTPDCSRPRHGRRG